MSYELKPDVQYPFATLQLKIALDKNGRGLDCTNFDEIFVYARSEGTKSKLIRLDFRNDHPDYTVKDDPVSLKYNEIYIPLNSLSSPLHLTWAHFHVASWWLAQHNISYEQGQVDVSNVKVIEFVTPETDTEGKGEIEVSRIELRGKWMSDETFFKLLLILWMSVLSIHVVFNMLQLRSVIYEKIKRERELVQMNSALSIQANELKVQAERDPLTGLHNRYGVRGRLLEMLKTVRQDNREVAAIFADIDFFKKINDTLGHSEGDRILKHVADIFSKNIRETDLVARWGGEEFLFFSMGTDNYGASLLAEKLRKKLQESEESVTCSFGIATLQGGTIQDLIQRADDALYKAKESGRNCVCISEDAPKRQSKSPLS
ncbi:MAG: GGDEF domain-containing protein [Deltaproteobacteria bacterium]|nr:GGDEF domain-containing protein [Deltaproteobacteria bacterium]